jgi:hypothetical protein
MALPWHETETADLPQKIKNHQPRLRVVACFATGDD